MPLRTAYFAGILRPRFLVSWGVYTLPVTTDLPQIYPRNAPRHFVNNRLPSDCHNISHDKLRLITIINFPLVGDGGAGKCGKRLC